MGRSSGYRSNTRSKFSRPFRENGLPHLSTYLVNYKIGDFVDIKANGAIHKGMPHKFYHGRTGRVWNVTPRAIGVVVNKRVGNRIIPKRIHVRIEHVQKSKCHEDFLKRVKANEAIKAAARANKTKPVGLKREPGWPKPGKLVKPHKKIIDVAPKPFRWVL